MPLKSISFNEGHGTIWYPFYKHQSQLGPNSFFLANMLKPDPITSSLKKILIFVFISLRETYPSSTIELYCLRHRNIYSPASHRTINRKLHWVFHWLFASLLEEKKNYNWCAVWYQFPLLRNMRSSPPTNIDKRLRFPTI